MNLIDDSRFVRLIFGVHREPGAYALLLGSGVSRGTGMLSGWEITVKLVEELAEIQEPGAKDALVWYKSQYGEEPRYDRALESLGKGSADRQAIVRRFFEPTQAERENGIKIPGVAHKSIAWLVKQGYIRLILTTNFDRLLEGALSDVGVTPNVVNGAEGIDGARSYASEQCTIVKINGDYQDTRIRNSVPELSEYPASLNTYLSAILDAYGLVICGWSATYDEALVRLLISHPNLRYGTYWLTNENLGREAMGVANRRKADVIPIVSADQAFQALADTIQSQDAGTCCDSFTADQITNTVRACVGNPTREAQLADILQEESRQVREAMPGIRSDLAELDQKTVQIIIQRSAAAVDTLASATAYVSYYGTVEHVRWTLNAFGRVAQKGLDLLANDASGGLTLLPGVLIAFASLTGALLTDKPDTAARILLSPIVRIGGTSVHWTTRINELTVFGAILNSPLMPAGKRGQIGAGTIILEALERMRYVHDLDISQASFTASYRVAEYAIGLVAQAHIEKEGFNQYNVPSGTILRHSSLWSEEGDERRVGPLETDFLNSGLKRALLDNGFAGGSSKAFDITEAQYRDMLAIYERSSG
jgi:hypothetical protein